MRLKVPALRRETRLQRLRWSGILMSPNLSAQPALSRRRPLVLDNGVNCP
jgi:hypothetical protein